jgi:hypothetical protein
MSLRAHHLDTVAGRLRNGFNILSPLNEKTPKGEAEGYLTALLYMAPATLAGGKTLCPHSTEACRSGCLYTAGRGRTPRVENARLRRARLYLNDRDTFFDELIGELVRLQDVADREGMKLAIRLNGTSDIGWEREMIDGQTLFDLFPRATFYDYSRWPPQHRRVPSNWRLTFSLADDSPAFAVGHLRAGRNVAAIVPLHEKLRAPAWFALGDTEVQVVDGEEHDLRFLDPSPALVLLKPKGRLLQGPSPMVHEGLILKLMRAGREVA